MQYDAYGNVSKGSCGLRTSMYMLALHVVTCASGEKWLPSLHPHHTTLTLFWSYAVFALLPAAQAHAR